MGGILDKLHANKVTTNECEKMGTGVDHESMTTIRKIRSNSSEPFGDLFKPPNVLLQFPLHFINIESSIMLLAENRLMTEQGPRFDCLLFDYVNQKLGVEKSRVPDLSKRVVQTYGTTMAGLRAVGYEFDYDDYHSFVHGRLPYEDLKPDPMLKNLLLSMPQRKIIFTDSDKVHTAKVLNRLGLEDCFEGIICFETLNPLSNIAESNNEWNMPANNSTIPKTSIICKPSKDAMEQALRLANADPQKTIW